MKLTTMSTKIEQKRREIFRNMGMPRPILPIFAQPQPPVQQRAKTEDEQNLGVSRRGNYTGDGPNFFWVIHNINYEQANYQAKQAQELVIRNPAVYKDPKQDNERKTGASQKGDIAGDGPSWMEKKHFGHVYQNCCGGILLRIISILLII